MKYIKYKLQCNYCFGFSCVDTSPCSKNEFECGNRMCVSDKAKCNGIYDCLDQTDEKDCRKYIACHIKNINYNMIIHKRNTLYNMHVFDFSM